MTTYLEPSKANAIALVKRGWQGPITMLNLIRLNKTAKYESEHQRVISGKEAFQTYIDETLPFLESSGGKIVLLADTAQYFIGPQNEYWDLVMIIEQASLESFFSFASNTQYQKVLRHRTAAVADSRLLPMKTRKMV